MAMDVSDGEQILEIVFGNHGTGRSYEHTRRLSGVKRTVTPASTLPTVRETSIVAVGGGEEKETGEDKEW